MADNIDKIKALMNMYKFAADAIDRDAVVDMMNTLILADLEEMAKTYRRCEETDACFMGECVCPPTQAIPLEAVRRYFGGKRNE